MKRRIDVAALNVGLVCLALGGLVAWSLIGHVSWGVVLIAAPVGLVVLGLLGLVLSRTT